MATDATGSPTALGIPKYNTSADAPSGLGFNAAMDAIDALIAARVLKPAGIASGEVPVWNGSTWVRSTTTQIGLSSIATIPQYSGGINVGSANTDLALANTTSPVLGYGVTVGGGTLRSISAGVGGQRVIIRNYAGSAITLKYGLGGGSGVTLNLRGASDLVLATGDAVELWYDGGNWSEVSRDVAAAVTTTYRKTTAKIVNTTVAATDLLNAEITVAANAMGATGVLRLTAWGDWLNNSGGTVAPPRFQLKLGATTILDTNAGGGVVTSAARQSWEIDVKIQNSATNAQTAKLIAYLNSLSNTAGLTAFTTGNGQVWESGNLIQMEGVNSGLAVDTTVANALVLNVINGSASATYETKLFGALIEVV